MKTGRCAERLCEAHGVNNDLEKACRARVSVDDKIQ